jgi:hypothetical protein
VQAVRQLTNRERRVSAQQVNRFDLFRTDSPRQGLNDGLVFGRPAELDGVEHTAFRREPKVFRRVGGGIRVVERTGCDLGRALAVTSSAPARSPPERIPEGGSSMNLAERSLNRDSRSILYQSHAERGKPQSPFNSEDSVRNTLDSECDNRNVRIRSL